VDDYGHRLDVRGGGLLMALRRRRSTLPPVREAAERIRTADPFITRATVGGWFCEFPGLWVAFERVWEGRNCPVGDTVRDTLWWRDLVGVQVLVAEHHVARDRSDVPQDLLITRP